MALRLDRLTEAPEVRLILIDRASEQAAAVIAANPWQVRARGRLKRNRTMAAIEWTTLYAW